MTAPRVARTQVLTLRHAVTVPTGPAAVTYPSRECVLVRVEDADGRIGWGETYLGPGLAGVAAEIGRSLLGSAHRSARVLVDVMSAAGADSAVVSAWSIALDDLRARQLGVPVSDLYGGRRRESVRAYASSGGYRDGLGAEAGWIDDVASASGDGFTACKLRIGRYDPAVELPGLQRVRESADPGLHLMVDANGAYSVPVAREVGARLAGMGFDWFEEPLIRFRNGMSYPGYEALTGLGIPIAGGEGLPGRGAFDAFLSRGAVDIIQPDVALCGGIAEALFIAELGALRGRPCVPHAWGGVVLMAATLQLLSLIPEPSELPGICSPMLEYDRFENRMHSELRAGGPFTVTGGEVRIPDGPGLGIELDTVALKDLTVAVQK